jgi:hypothetical protein
MMWKQEKVVWLTRLLYMSASFIFFILMNKKACPRNSNLNLYYWQEKVDIKYATESNEYSDGVFLFSVGQWEVRLVRKQASMCIG